MATTVTAPLERQFGQIQGLNQMTSTSSFGSSVIALQFDLDLNIDIAEQEVQAAINAARKLSAARPAGSAGLQQGEPRGRAGPDAGAHLRSMPLPQVEDLADTRLAPKISQLTGVGLVSISGGQKPAVRIQANPDRAVLLRPQPRRPAHRPRPRPT